MKRLAFSSALLCFMSLSGCGSPYDAGWVEQKYTSPTSEFVSIDGNRVHFRDEGAGEVIVLIHGTSSSLHAWDAWAGQLEKAYRVIRMDLPGFGLTGPDSRNRYEVKDDIRFLNAFLEARGVDQVHLAGSSLGGRIAWEYSTVYPQKVTSLTLINALGYPQKSWPLGIEMAQWPVFDDIIARFSPRVMFEISLREVYFDVSQVNDALVDRYFELSRYPGNMAAFPKRVQARLDSDAEKITRVSVPTLIMWGEEDRYFPVENAHRFKADITDSELQVYPAVSHLPMEEIPRRSVEDFIRFVGKHPGQMVQQTVLKAS